ncbi:MAG: hypothetical protein HFJ66_09985 [Eggerthellaceae bacterium]|nr:hypothetical protein [Eggerthellaceae bacterium]
MNPVLIIPTFHTGRRHRAGSNAVATYDHATPLNEPGELDRCLASLEKVEDLGLVIVLVSAEAAIARQADEKVRAIAEAHPALNVMVIGTDALALIRQRMEQLNVGKLDYEIGLSGYGATRNVGLVVASVLGFDAAVFIDDDEVIDDPRFMHTAMYGLGKLTRKGIPILAKTGYYINDQGSYLSKWEDAWYNRFWQQGAAFNQWISAAMKGPRLSRSNHVCGGCLAVHKEAFRRLAFDPWIARGEDLDYMLDLRMYGSDIWFDNKWKLRHLPPASASEGDRFRQDIFRWVYEYRKLEYSRALIDLQQVKPESLEPYPGPFLEPGLTRRIMLTAWMRSIALDDKKAYRRAAKAARKEAQVFAERNCAKYFSFQYTWPELVSRIEGDQMLARALVNSALVAHDLPMPAEAPVAAAPQPAAPARTPNIDPGATTEIRLNLSDFE